MQNSMKDEFPKTPEHFKNVVKDCVRQQIETDKPCHGDLKTDHFRIDKRKQKKHSRGAAVAVAAVTLLVGTTVAAAGSLRLGDYFEKINKVEDAKDYIQINDTSENSGQNEGDSSVAESGITQSCYAGLPEFLKQADIEGSAQFTEPLVQIQEIYFDGGDLYFYGEATEAGKSYDFYSSRVIINGEQYIGDFGQAASVGNYLNLVEDISDYEFVGVAHLSSGSFTENFTVELPLSIDSLEDPARKRLGYQTITFEVDGLDKLRTQESQKIEIDGGYVQIDRLNLSDTGIYMEWTWHMAGDEGRLRALELDRFYRAEMIYDDQGNCHNTVYDGMVQTYELIEDEAQAHSEGRYVEMDEYADENNEDMATLYNHRIFQDEEGNWCVRRVVLVEDLSKNASTLSVKPYIVKNFHTNETPTQEQYIDGAFTVQLK